MEAQGLLAQASRDKLRRDQVMAQKARFEQASPDAARILSEVQLRTDIQNGMLVQYCHQVLAQRRILSRQVICHSR